MNPNRFAAFALLLASMGLAAGCTAASHQSVPLPAQDVTVTRPDLARIYFVREDRTGLHRNKLLVFDGETEIGGLTPDTYLCWERAGGRSLGRAFYEAIDPSKGKIEGVIDLDCPAGRAYYFNVIVDREGGKPSVVALDPEEGRHLVASRRPAGKH
jgi:hypothetical protein